MKRTTTVLALVLCAVFALAIAIPTIASNTQEDYRAWGQDDARWINTPLGNSSYRIDNGGCLVTAITKVIIQAGLEDPQEFNIGTFVKSLNSIGGFSSQGGIDWYAPQRVVNGLAYEGKTDVSASVKNSESVIMDYVRRGYHLVIEVNSGSTHYVAVDNELSLSTGEVYIMDSYMNPARSADIRLTDYYTYVYNMQVFSGGSVYIPNNEITKNGKYLCGDVNSDGKINSDDSALAYKNATLYVQEQSIEATESVVLKDFRPEKAAAVASSAATKQ